MKEHVREREEEDLWQKSVAALRVEDLRGTHDFLM